MHDAPCARVDEQADPGAPLAIAPDASHELPLHTAVSVRVPALHDLCPDKVYPVLHVGEHVAPSARVEVQPGPGAPLAMAPDASHELASHVVSDPLASSSAAFVVPAGHAVQTLEDTNSFTPHSVASHVVSDPTGTSLAAFVVPAGHALHTFDETYSFTEHNELGLNHI